MIQFMRNGVLSLLMLLAACGGRPEPAKPPPPPPPPIDEDLLNLVPYESDLVVWFDIARLKTSEIWGLVEKVLGQQSIGIPLDTSLQNPLLACDEIVMAYLENETQGSQLVIIAKGDPPQIAALRAAFGKDEKAVPVDVEGFEGVRASRILLVPFTERTVAFGNRAIVRMSAKTGVAKSRPLRENPHFQDFETGGGPALKLRYRSGVTAQVIEKFKAVAPKINPNAVTGMDAAVYVESGFDLQVDIATQTQMDASVIAGDLKRTQRELKGNMIVLFLGVTWVLDRIRVSSEKDQIRVEVKLDSRDISELGHLVERLQKIKELLDDSGGPPFQNPMRKR